MLPCRCGVNLAFAGPITSESSIIVWCGNCDARTVATQSLDRAIAIWNAMQSEARKEHESQ